VRRRKRRWRISRQTNANQSQFARERRISGRAELTPLGKGSGAVELDDVPAGEAAFLIEGVADGGVDGGAPETVALAIDLPEHLVGVPAPLRESRRSIDALAPDLDPALVQQVR